MTGTDAGGSAVAGGGWPAMDGWIEVRLGEQVRTVALTDEALTIGRAPTNGMVIENARVSRLHAVIERFPAGWSIRDLGSTNGTAVNGRSLRRAHSLHDGDVITIGPAVLVMRSPGDGPVATTQRTAGPASPPRLTPREQDVIDALCRPATDGETPFVQPPTVRHLADELGMSESAVKKHLANLYDKFSLVTNDQRRRGVLAAEAARRSAYRPPGNPALDGLNG